MFSIELRTNKKWNVKNMDLEPNEWTQLPMKLRTQDEAEKELAWLQLAILDSASATIDLRTNYRICEGSNVIFEK